MKTYKMLGTSQGGVIPVSRKGGEWVPAEVAQGLYDIVAALVEHGAWYPSAIELDHAIGCGPGGDDLESDAIAALAAADGEEV